ncbi:MAG: hypothetical protein ACYDDF_03690 [Thermoplasmatota archaeon]
MTATSEAPIPEQDEMALRLAQHPAWERFDRAWRKLSPRVRTLIEAFLVRALVTALLALLILRLLDDVGYIARIRAIPNIPLVNVQIPLTKIGTTLDTGQMVFWLVVTFAAGATFSPWRAPTVVFGLTWLVIAAVGIQYTRVTTTLLQSYLPLNLGGFLPTQATDPPLTLVLEGMLLLVVAGLFATAEASRAVRRAYEEKGIMPLGIRNIVSIQIVSMALVGLGAFLGAVVVYELFTGLFPLLRTVSLPRVNPVLMFFIMGLCLSLLVLAFAWKPQPNQDPQGFRHAFRLMIGRDRGKDKTPPAEAEPPRRPLQPVVTVPVKPVPNPSVKEEAR